MTSLFNLVFMFFLILVPSISQASSPEWITHVTKGNIKLTEAIKISKSIYVYSFKYNIDPNVLFKIAKVESNFNRKARSSHNAKGLFQIITRYHLDKIKGRDIYNIDVNTDVAAQIYNEYLSLYKTPNRALRAYNGSHRSNQYPLKVSAVKLSHYSSPYPGSDDRKYANLTLPVLETFPISSITLQDQICTKCMSSILDCDDTDLPLDT